MRMYRRNRNSGVLTNKLSTDNTWKGLLIRERQGLCHNLLTSDDYRVHVTYTLVREVLKN